MKKLLLLLCVFLSTAVRAQEFYEPSDLDVMWRVWDDEWTFNWLIENGNKVDVSVNPAPRYSHSSVVAPTEVCLSFVKTTNSYALPSLSQRVSECSQRIRYIPLPTISLL